MPFDLPFDLPFYLTEVQRVRDKIVSAQRDIAEQEQVIAVLEVELETEYNHLFPNEKKLETNHVVEAPLSVETKLRQELAESGCNAKRLQLWQKRKNIESCKVELQVMSASLNYYERCGIYLVSLAEFNQRHECQVKETSVQMMMAMHDSPPILAPRAVTCNLGACSEDGFVTTVAAHIQQRALGLILQLADTQTSVQFNYYALLSSVNAYTVVIVLAEKLKERCPFSVEYDADSLDNVLKQKVRLNVLVQFVTSMESDPLKMRLVAKTYVPKTYNFGQAASPRVNP